MKKGLIGLVVAMLLVPYFAYAAQIKTGESEVNVAKNENATNLIIGAQTVNVDGMISKDLVAGANTININGNVAESVIAGANTINIKGNVGSNVRTGSKQLVVSGTVGGDITSAGSEITTKEGSVVNGDIMVAARTLELNGNVTGNVYFTGQKLVINGPIYGFVKANAKTIEFGDKGVVYGNLTYWSPGKAKFDSAKVKGTVTHHQQAEVNFNFKGFWFFNLIAKSLGLLILLLLLVWLMPRFAKNYASETYRNLWKNLGWGAFTLFIIPLIMLLLLITFVGIPLALLIGLFYSIFLITAGILVPLAIGSLVWKLVKRTDKYEANWKVVLVGIASFFILNLIPVIGWLVVFAFFLFSLGEVSMTVWGVFRKQKRA